MKGPKLASLIAAAIALCPIHQVAYAVTMASGPITDLRVDVDGDRAYVKIEAANSTGSLPACATGSGYSVAFSLSTPSGEAIMNMLIAAKQSGSVVYLRGKGTCTVVSTFEDLSYAVTQDD